MDLFFRRFRGAEVCRYPRSLLHNAFLSQNGFPFVTARQRVLSMLSCRFGIAILLLFTSRYGAQNLRLTCVCVRYTFPPFRSSFPRSNVLFSSPFYNLMWSTRRYSKLQACTRIRECSRSSLSCSHARAHLYASSHSEGTTLRGERRKERGQC